MRLLEHLLGDLRQALRQLRLAPGFTVATVLTLALGIGVNTAVFGLFNATLLKTPTVREPDRLVALWRSTEPGDFTSGLSQFSWPDYSDLRRWSTSFDDIAAQAWLTIAIRARGVVISTDGRMVTANYFSVLGVEPQLGRGFLPHEASTPGTEAVIVLSDVFWSEHLDRAPDIIGSTVHLDDVPFTVVGVTPEGFVGVHPLATANFWVPATMTEVLLPTWARLTGGGSFSRRDLDWLHPIGRLAEGVPLEEARAEMATIAARFDWEHTAATIRLYRDIGLHPSESRELRTWASFALPLVGLVLLLACANVASLVLARAAPRRRDFAVRLAIGCAPGRLLRLLAIEGAVLAVAAGLAAIVAAVALRRVLPSLIPYFPGATTNLDMWPDIRVVGFTLIACGMAWLLFAVAPAVHASRLDLVPSLKGLSGRRGTGRRALSRLVVGQIALAVLLLSFSAPDP